MKKLTLVSLTALTLIGGLGDYLIQPMPAGAESEAGLEAPMFVGRRRHRGRWGRGGGNQMQNQQQKEQQKQQAAILKQDQMQEKQHARELAKLKERDIIHEYGSGASNTGGGNGTAGGYGSGGGNGGGRRHKHRNQLGGQGWQQAQQNRQQP